MSFALAVVVARALALEPELERVTPGFARRAQPLCLALEGNRREAIVADSGVHRALSALLFSALLLVPRKKARLAPFREPAVRR
jgi:hypothetical protein